MRIKNCFELHHRLGGIGQCTNSTTHPHFSITQSPSEPRYPPSARFFFRRGNLCPCFWIAFGAPSKIMSLLPFLHVYVFFYNLPLIISDVG